jgi:Icc-related predicted phosphoesterase
MKLLAFSDVHCDLDQAAELAERSAEADVVVGAGDFGSVHKGVGETVAALSGIEKPAILVPGNNETEEELRAAAASWPSATVLHGSGAEVDGVAFYGLGAGVPSTPWSWSFDLDEAEAEAMLADCPEGGVLVVHSPPKGHADQRGSGDHLGSEAILAAIERCQPRYAVCGHIHESWRARSMVGKTEVVNLGPYGTLLEL